MPRGSGSVEKLDLERVGTAGGGALLPTMSGRVGGGQGSGLGTAAFPARWLL